MPADPSPEPGPTAATAAIIDPEEPAPTPTPPKHVEDRDPERGLRGLVGAGNSQVSLGAAQRARDAARPTAEQLAHSAEHLVIVRRGWVPREQLPRVNP